MIGFFCVYKEEKDMLISIAFMLMLGMFLGWVCRKLRLPGLMGMIFTGVLLGPYALNLIDVTILNISSELRWIALIIILMRAGISLDLNDLKKVGRPAVLMCFLPACFEILGRVLRGEYWKGAGDKIESGNVGLNEDAFFLKELAEEAALIVKTDMDSRVGCFGFVAEDGGIGMAPEFLEKLFMLFERACPGPFGIKVRIKSLLKYGSPPCVIQAYPI